MQNSINASMRIVPDTMILVHLARLGLLNEKLKTFTEILLPQMVFDEATSGKERYPDAQIIEDTLKEAENVRIMSSDYQKTSLETLGLQKGGREAVSLYLEK
ncbi:MAG: hypothetical protein ACFFDI_22575, partial [Promethearchaeota archaeon]